MMGAVADGDETMNSAEAIQRASVIAEKFRDALTAAVAGTDRSPDLQVAFLTGYIAEAIDEAVEADRRTRTQQQKG